jgi:predicted phage baseplate assembly protein
VNQAGNLVVQFGNGVQGARTPTGQSNIRAAYRKGIGEAGMVDAGQLSMPLDRPQGLKSVSNPSPASGAADPASAADARASAPLPTLTINRIVSLEDFQNYALAFPGIAKALASWLWFGTTRGVFLTVAGEGGALLQPDDLVITNLVQAIKSFGNPYIPLQVASYAPRFFQFTASLKIDTYNYSPPLVLAQVWAALSAAFDFSQRQFGQPVVASEIIELIQQTPGVIALELQALNYSGDSPSLPVSGMLVASAPTPGQNTPPLPAEMLLLDPATINNIGVWK